MAAPRLEHNAERETDQEPGRLIDLLPRNNKGCFIFTTRDRKAAVKLASERIIKVQEMNEKTAAQLLETCLARPSLTEHHQSAEAVLAELHTSK